MNKPFSCNSDSGHAVLSTLTWTGWGYMVMDNLIRQIGAVAVIIWFNLCPQLEWLDFLIWSKDFTLNQNVINWVNILPPMGSFNQSPWGLRWSGSLEHIGIHVCPWLPAQNSPVNPVRCDDNHEQTKLAPCHSDIWAQNVPDLLYLITATSTGSFKNDDCFTVSACSLALNHLENQADRGRPMSIASDLLSPRILILPSPQADWMDRRWAWPERVKLLSLIATLSFMCAILIDQLDSHSVSLLS